MLMVREMDYELDHDLPDVACLRCTGRGQERPSITELRLPQVALLELQLKKSLPAMQQVRKCTLYIYTPVVSGL